MIATYWQGLRLENKLGIGVIAFLVVLMVAIGFRISYIGPHALKAPAQSAVSEQKCQGKPCQDEVYLPYKGSMSDLLRMSVAVALYYEENAAFAGDWRKVDPFADGAVGITPSFAGARVLLSSYRSQAPGEPPYVRAVRAMRGGHYRDAYVALHGSPGPLAGERLSQIDAAQNDEHFDIVRNRYGWEDYLAAVKALSEAGL